MTDGINRSRHCVRRSLSLSLSLSRARARELVTEIRRETAAKCAHVHCARASGHSSYNGYASGEAGSIHSCSERTSGLPIYNFPFTIYHPPLWVLHVLPVAAVSHSACAALDRRPLAGTPRVRASGTRASRPELFIFWSAESLRFRDAFSFRRHSGARSPDERGTRGPRSYRRRRFGEIKKDGAEQMTSLEAQARLNVNEKKRRWTGSLLSPGFR